MSKDIVVREKTLPSTEVLHSLVSEDIPTDKILIPRINLLQALSDAVQSDGQKQGTFNNSITKENYGETVNLIPLSIKFGALYLEKGVGMKCRSADGVTNMFGDSCAKCPFNVNYKTWHEGKPPKCTQTVDLLALETETMQPAVLTFRATSYKEGLRLATQLKLSRQAIAVRIGGFKDKNDHGTFFILKMLAVTPLSKEQHEIALKWREMLKQSAYEVADENAEGSAAA